jgi:hypothetical protein
VTYVLAALFFSLAFIGAAAAIHMTVRAYWFEILTALRGELGVAVSPAAEVRTVRRPAPQRAAF